MSEVGKTNNSANQEPPTMNSQQLNQDFLAFINYENWAQLFEKNLLASIPGLNAALIQSNANVISAMAALTSAPKLGSECQPTASSDRHPLMSHPLVPILPSMVEDSCSSVLPESGDVSQAVTLMKNKVVSPSEAEMHPSLKQDKKMIYRKPNYTKEDLEKAILDIRSGRTGTRRAAIAFGIPRSTIRNHIRKLEAEDLLTGIEPTGKRIKAGGLAKCNSTDSVMVNSNTRTRSKDGEDSRGASSSVGNSTDKSADKGRILTKETQMRKLNSTHTPRIFPNLFDAPNPAEFLNQMISSIFHPYADTPSASKMGPTTFRSSSGNQGQRMRGQYRYRRYSQQTMAEAIQAVRSGQMGVYRAGTHYGVPHSTLEYKVKQVNRPLMKSDNESPSEGSNSPSSSTDGLFSFLFEGNAPADGNI